MLLHDFAYIARTLRGSPGFAVAAVLTISLGVGVTTSIFAVANTVLLRSLPYTDPDRLVFAIGEFRKRNVADWPFSNANFVDLRRGARTTFEDIGSVFTFRSILRKEDGALEQVRTAIVTPNFFRLLGAEVALGRDFLESDGQPEAQLAQRLPTIAILSYQYWERRYGANPAILGHRATNGAQIVGVLSPGFELLFPPGFNVESRPDIWTAGRFDYDYAQRSNVSHHVIGRLKRGAALEQARAEVETVAASIRRVDRNHETAGFHIRVEPMRGYLVADVRPVILSLMGAAVFLLLIACANVANLLLVRVSMREREFAVRAALGGRRLRLVRQTAAEAVLLAALGAFVGLVLAWVGIRRFLTIAPADLPRLESIALDSTVLGFTALASLTAAVIVGLAPALRASRPDLMTVLRGGGLAAELRGGRTLRNGVVMAQLALSLVLLTGSGLMLRSFVALQRIDPGYDPQGILTFLLLNGQGGGSLEQRAASIRAIQERLRALPGVEKVAASSPFPLTGGFYPIRWGTEQAMADPTKFQAAETQTVLPDYFETLRTQLIAGRTFTEADNSPSRTVVIVDELLAAKAFPNEPAVGKRILVRARRPQPEWVEVIGVVARQRTTSLARTGREQIYFTDGFNGHGAVARWAVRTAGDPGKMETTIRAELAGLGQHLFLTEMQPMEALVSRAQARTRFSLLLMSVFAAVAAVLAAVGLYGVLATAVRQRTAEIGIRMALGAAPAGILKMVVGQGLWLAAGGVATGLVMAVGLTRFIASMLVDTGSTDAATFSAVAVSFLAIAALASWLPARRASALNPAAALRNE
ncbi:MAG: ABC transporter permease [Bryobacteraceae bacterium]|nr:ABC transporter permease [Bryobacteraceae bacterium]